MKPTADYFTPSTWPKKARQAFLLTLPLSLPLWLGSIIVGIGCGFLIFISAAPFVVIFKMWSEE